MTCIVGIVEKDKICIAGDSALTDKDGHLTTLHKSKVFQVGDFYIGYCGDLRFGQLLESENFSPPAQKRGQSEYQFLISRFVPYLMNYLTNNLYPSETLKEDIGDMFLVYKSGLYLITYMGIIEVTTYDAVGSGADYAKGCLYGIVNQKSKIETKASKAIEAASKFCTSVTFPVNYLVIDRNV